MSLFVAFFNFFGAPLSLLLHFENISVIFLVTLLWLFIVRFGCFLTCVKKSLKKHQTPDKSDYEIVAKKKKKRCKNHQKNPSQMQQNWQKSFCNFVMFCCDNCFLQFFIILTLFMIMLLPLNTFYCHSCCIFEDFTISL